MKVTIQDTRRLCNMGFMVLAMGTLLQLLLTGVVGEMCLFLGGGMVLWSEVAPVEDQD